MKQSKRGSGLATVLMVTAIATTLAFTTVGLSFHHLSATSKMGNGYYAKNLAEAALAKGIDKILQDQTFGQTVNAASTIRVNFPDAPGGSFGLLTFDGVEAQNYNNANPGPQLPSSFNNLSSDTPRLAPEANVPGYAVFLSAVGVCKGTTRRVDTVIYVPKFPWAVASSGSIRSSGDIFLASVRKGGDPNLDADLLPASLATNSAAGDTAVEFAGSNITIKGDLQSHSGAKLGSALVLGEKRLNAAAITLPGLNVTDYNTQNKNGVQNLPDIQASTPIKGFAHRSGSLLCADGLVLDGAVLYVDGDLDVTGGIKGTGAVIVKGKTTVTGTSTFIGDNNLALLSKGDVQISGTASKPSQFRGMLYSEGNLSASHTSLVGTVIANDKSGGSGGQITLDKSRVIQDSTSSAFNMTVTTGSGTNDPIPAGKQSFIGFPAIVDWAADPSLTVAENQAIFLSSPAGKAADAIRKGGGLAADRWGTLAAPNVPTTVFKLPSPGPGTFSGLQPNETTDLKLGLGLRTDLSPTRFLDSVSKKYVMPITTGTKSFSNPDGSALQKNTTYVTESTGNGAADFRFVQYTGSVAPVTEADLIVKLSGQSEMDASDPSWKTTIENQYIAQLNSLLVSRRGTGLTIVESAIAKSLVKNQLKNVPSQIGQSASLAIAIADKARSAAAQTITFEDGTNPNYVPPTGGTSTETWSIDLNDNRLIPFAERVRVLYWRENFSLSLPAVEQGRAVA